MLTDFLLFVVIGFAAQIIDGAIGMAYGLISTTVLLSIGVAPSTAYSMRIDPPAHAVAERMNPGGVVRMPRAYSDDVTGGHQPGSA
jgi:hypothetical protein